MSDNGKRESGKSPKNLDDSGNASEHTSILLRDSRLIEKVRIKPRGQERVFLGNFENGAQPLGFSVEVTPDPEPTDSVETQVVTIGTAHRYKLIMNIANYGAKAVRATIRQL
jgi:hypothetical protein